MWIQKFCVSEKYDFKPYYEFCGQLAREKICAKSKNRIYNSVSFFLKCEKRGTLVGPTCFSTFLVLCEKHKKNRVVAKKIEFFFKSTKIGFTVLKDIHFL